MFWEIIIVAFELAIEAALGWLPVYEKFGLEILARVYLADFGNLIFPMLGTYMHLSFLFVVIAVIMFAETLRFLIFLYNFIYDQVPGLK